MNAPNHEFRHKSALGYQKIQLKIYSKKYIRNSGIHFYRWIICAIIGAAWINAIYILL